MMAQVKRILLVEDSLQDIELTMGALDECHLANQLVRMLRMTARRPWIISITVAGSFAQTAERPARFLSCLI